MTWIEYNRIISLKVIVRLNIDMLVGWIWYVEGESAVWAVLAVYRHVHIGRGLHLVNQAVIAYSEVRHQHRPWLRLQVGIGNFFFTTSVTERELSFSFAILYNNFCPENKWGACNCNYTDNNDSNREPNDHPWSTISITEATSYSTLIHHVIASRRRSLHLKHRVYSIFRVIMIFIPFRHYALATISLSWDFITNDQEEKEQLNE